jgi:hypothetical protein
VTDVAQAGWWQAPDGRWFPPQIDEVPESGGEPGPEWGSEDTPDAEEWPGGQFLSVASFPPERILRRSPWLTAVAVLVVLGLLTLAAFGALRLVRSPASPPPLSFGPTAGTTLGAQQAVSRTAFGLDLWAATGHRLSFPATSAVVARFGQGWRLSAVTSGPATRRGQVSVLAQGAQVDLAARSDDGTCWYEQLQIQPGRGSLQALYGQSGGGQTRCAAPGNTAAVPGATWTASGFPNPA